MIISHTNKFVYFKAPKVAGTSTEYFFEEFCDKQNDIIGLREKQLRRFSSRIEAMQTLNNKFWNHMPPLLIKQQMNQFDWQNY